MGKEVSEIILMVPTVADGETTKYHLMGQNSKIISCYITQVVNRIQEQGLECYKIHSVTEYADGSSADEISIVQIEEGPIPVSTHRVVRSKDGTSLTDSKLVFKNSAVEIPSNPVLSGVDGLSFCLRGCTFAHKKKIEVNSMCVEGTVLRMHGTVSKDKISVPAGTFECYKIEMAAELMETMGYKTPPGMGAIMDHFMPTNCYWFTQDEPHYLVKFEGCALSSVAAVHRLPDEGEQALQELIEIMQ